MILETAFTRGIAFIMLPVYTSVLTPREYGIINLAEAAAALLVVIALCGLTAGIHRLYFLHPEGSAEQGTLVASVVASAFLLAGVGAGVSFVAGPSLIRLFPDFSAPFYPFVALAVGAAFFTALNQIPLGLWQIRERFGSYAIASVAVAALTTAFVVVGVVVLRQGAVGMLAGKLAGIGFAFLVGLVWVLPLLRARPRLDSARSALRFSMLLVPHHVFALVLTVGDRFVIEWFRSVEDVGAYSIAYVLGSAMMLVTQVVMRPWSPIYYRLAAERSERSRRTIARVDVLIITALAAAATVGSAIGPAVSRLFVDVRYESGLLIIPIVIAGYFAHAVAIVFSFGVLQGNRTWVIAAVTTVAAVFNVVANIVLVPPFGIAGAAWATFGSYFIEAVALYVATQWMFTIPRSVPRLLLAPVAFGITLVTTQLAPEGAIGVVAEVGATAVSLGALWWVGGRDLLVLYRERRVGPDRVET